MVKTKSDHKDNLLIDTIRVVPTQHKLNKIKETDRLTDLLAVLLIFGIAVFIRFYVREVFISSYGDHVFYLTVGDNDPLGIGAYAGVAAGDKVLFEGYDDFHYYYLDYVDNLLDGWNPYSGSRTDGDHLGGYVYGPIYIYLISFGAYFFDLSAYDSIVYGNIIFDSLSYVMVYLLAKRVTGNVIALFMALLGSFSPVALFYANIRGLNAPQMTFFALVFVYYFLEKKDNRAIFFLAMATMTKQFPLFLALPVGFWMMRRYGLLKGVAFILMFIFDVLVLSLPWIVLDPRSYVIRLFLPGGGKSQVSCPQGGEATNLVHGGLVEVCQTYDGQTIPTDQVPAYSQFLFGIVNSHILFFGFVFLFGWIALTGYDYFENDNKYYYKFFAAFYTIVHATIARGIYKYYLTMLIPFIILAFIPGNTEKSLNIRIGALINRSFTSLLEPKNRIKDTSVGYWTEFVVLILGIAGVIWTIDATITLFTKADNYHIFWLVILIPLAIYYIYRPGSIDINQTEEKIENDEVLNKLPFLLLIATGAFYFLIKVAVIYFSEESDYRTNTNIMIGIMIIFITIPYLNKYNFKEKTTFKFFNLEYDQLIWDIIGLLIAFFVINFLNKEIITVNRLSTTTILFIMGIILMGMLEIEIWASTVKVPLAAYRRYKNVRYDTQDISEENLPIQ